MSEDGKAFLGCAGVIVVIASLIFGVPAYQSYQEKKASTKFYEEMYKKVKDNPSYAIDYRIERLENELEMRKRVKRDCDSIEDVIYEHQLETLKRIKNPQLRKLDSLKMEIQRFKESDDDDIDLY